MGRAAAALICLASTNAFVAPSRSVARPSSSHAQPTTPAALRQQTQLNMVIPGDSAAEFVVISGTLNFLALYNALITARILLSWFPQAQGQPLLQPLFVVTDPFLNLFRGLGLNFGGLDFSILPAFFLLNALTNAVPALGADASFLVDPSALM